MNRILSFRLRSDSAARRHGEPLAGHRPRRRDQLLYAPSGRVGPDSFSYTVRDAAGLKGVGTVSVTLKPPRRLLDCWPFDETSGTTAKDLGPNGFDGALKGTLTFDTASVQGHFGRGLSFNGTSDYVDMGKTASQLGGINANAPRTITAWVCARTFNHGGVYEMGQDSATGQDFSLRTMNVDNQWRVQYWGMDIDFTADSKNKWVHFAHVHDGTTTRVYVNGRLAVSKACTLATGDGKNFQVGKWTTYYFDGVIDDLRVYDFALDAAAVRTVMLGRQAECVSPADSEGNLPQRATLTWLPAAAAEAHDVYLGTSHDDVANATMASPQYKGRQTRALYVPFLDMNTQYFWRIDEVVGGTVAGAGGVWSFTTGQYAGTITREIWTGVAGTAVTDLTYWWRYPRQPDSRDELTSFEEPINGADNYGTRVHGSGPSPNGQLHLLDRQRRSEPIVAQHRRRLRQPGKDRPNVLVGVVPAMGHVGRTEVRTDHADRRQGLLHRRVAQGESVRRQPLGGLGRAGDQPAGHLGPVSGTLRQGCPDAGPDDVGGPAACDLKHVDRHDGHDRSRPQRRRVLLQVHLGLRPFQRLAGQSILRGYRPETRRLILVHCHRPRQEL